MFVAKSIEEKNFNILSNLTDKKDLSFEYYFYNDVVIKLYFLHLYFYYFVANKDLNKLKDYNEQIFYLLENYRRDILEIMRYDNNVLKLLKDKIKDQLLDIFEEVVEFTGYSDIHKIKKVRKNFLKVNFYLMDNLYRLIKLNDK